LKPSTRRPAGSSRNVLAMAARVAPEEIGDYIDD